ncbi:hypothetical protein V1504DRAFT_471940 [Lipomyces starkeyi]
MDQDLLLLLFYHFLPLLFDMLIRFDKKHLTSRIVPVGESTYSSVDDQGGRSTKTPDAGLQYDNGQRNDFLIIFEAGVSDGYQQMKADIEFRIGILLWHKERPRFRFPARDGGNSLSATERGLFENSMFHSRRSRPFGPYSFNGHTWFGTLDIALIEVFKMDVHANDISSEQYVIDNNIPIEIALLVVVEDGAATLQADSFDIGLIMEDAFPFDEQLSVDEKAQPILLETECCSSSSRPRSTTQRSSGTMTLWTRMAYSVNASARIELTDFIELSYFLIFLRCNTILLGRSCAEAQRAGNTQITRAWTHLTRVGF